MADCGLSVDQAPWVVQGSYREVEGWSLRQGKATDVEGTKVVVNEAQVKNVYAVAYGGLIAGVVVVSALLAILG